MSLYLDTDTWLHHLHPVVRLLGMFALFVAAFVVERPRWQAPLLLPLAALVWWSGGLAQRAAAALVVRSRRSS